MEGTTGAGMTLRENAYNRAGRHCECTMRGCSHIGRCAQSLGGGWEILRVDDSGAYTLNNIVAVCEACFRRARGSAIGPLPGF